MDANIRSKILSGIESILDQGIFIGGPKVEEFENLFAETVSSGYGVAVGNGHDALVAALFALDVGPGQNVAVPAHTFISTFLAVLEVGATPIAVDINDHLQIDIASIEKLSQQIHAIIPVHMHGAVCDMVRLMEFAKQKNVKIIEDCSQAHGARINGIPVGAWGDAGAFSLYPTKNIGALGDAGIVVFKNNEHAVKAKAWRNYGSTSSKYVHTSIGRNSRLDPIQVPFLTWAVENMVSSIDRRKKIAHDYMVACKKNTKLSPIVNNPDDSVWHHFVLRVKDRDTFQNLAKNLGISTEIHYPILAALEISRITGDPIKTDLTKASSIVREIVSIPIFPELTTKQVEHICKFLEQF